MKQELEQVHLRAFADPEQTAQENVTDFLREVGRASLPDIVGACNAAWAVAHGAVRKLIDDGRVSVDADVHPWEYVWKVREARR